MSLKKFKAQFTEKLLTLLWRSWNALGAAGSGDAAEGPVDPEALLLLTATAARYDARLFDEMLDWLEINRQFINVQRIRNLIKKEAFASVAVIRAVATRMHRLDGGIRWKKLAEKPEPDTPAQPLFLLPDGKALPVAGDHDPDFLRYGYLRNTIVNRGHTQPFPAGEPATLHLQLRALFGLSVRAETVLFLLTHREASVREIADFSGWSWRSVQEVLTELTTSGTVLTDGANRNRRYQLDPAPWSGLLLKAPEPLPIPVPAAVYRVLELVLLCLHDEKLLQAQPPAQAAELRLLAEREILPRLRRAGCARALSGFRPAAGEAYIQEWIAMVERVVGVL